MGQSGHGRLHAGRSAGGADVHGHRGSGGDGALRVASLSGEVAVRKAEAARVADRVLNEAVVTANWNPAAADAESITENGQEFHWTLRSESWPVALTSTSPCRC